MASWSGQRSRWAPIATAIVATVVGGCGGSDGGGGPDGGPDAGAPAAFVNVEPFAMAFQGEKLVLAGVQDGDMWVGRFDRAGALDSTFGTEGTTTLDFGGSAALPLPMDLDVARAVLVTDTAIYLGGYARATSGGAYGSMTVVRLDAEGALDTSWGSGGSWITTVRDTDDQIVTTWINDLMIDGSDRLHSVGFIENPTNDMVVARYTAAGSLDSGFGLAAGVTGSILQLPGDEMGLGGVLTGSRLVGAGGEGIFLAALSLSGPVDTGFGTSGFVDLTGGNVSGLIEQADGSLVVAGVAPMPMDSTTHDALQIARLDASGALDPTFGAGGIATHAFDLTVLLVPGSPDIALDGTFTWVQGLAPLDDGGVLIMAAASGFLHTYPTLVRLDANGDLVTSFGSGGILGLPHAMPLLGDYDMPPASRLLVDGDDAWVCGYEFGAAFDGLFLEHISLVP